MKIACNRRQNALIVKLTGELDHHHSEQIRSMIEEAIRKQQNKHLLFDFSDLTFMDSSGIGMIIGRYKLMKSLGGTVSLVCKNKQMERLIHMSGLKKLISVYATVEQAMANHKEGQA